MRGAFQLVQMRHTCTPLSGRSLVRAPLKAAAAVDEMAGEMSASWLCPTDEERRRVTEASPRVRMIRTVGSGAVGVTLLISALWLGWWTLILFALSALNLL